MNQLERLQDWYAKTTITTKIVTVPALTRTSLVENNPNRIYLWFRLWFDSPPTSWFPVGSESMVEIYSSGYDTQLNTQRFHIEREYAFTTCGWDINTNANNFCTVAQCLYQG